MSVHVKLLLHLKKRFLFTELISNLTFNQTVKEQSPSWITALTWQRGLCKIMASSPITSWQAEGEKAEAVTFYLGATKSLRTVTAAPVAQMVKNLVCNAGDLLSIPGSGRPLREGNGNPLQYLAWRIP